jgi:hypothetical protein
LKEGRGVKSTGEGAGVTNLGRERGNVKQRQRGREAEAERERERGRDAEAERGAE